VEQRGPKLLVLALAVGGALFFAQVVSEREEDESRNERRHSGTRRAVSKDHWSAENERESDPSRALPEGAGKPIRGMIAECKSKLRAARLDGDLEVAKIETWITRIADHLEANPELGSVAADACRSLVREGAWLGAEIFATAIGRVRNEPGLKGLISMMESTLLDARHFHRFLVALTQTHRAERAEDCVAAYCRFSALRARVREPFVRAFLRRTLEHRATQGDAAACVAAASGLASGNIDDEEARNLVSLFEASSDPKLRSYLLSGMQHAAGSHIKNWALFRLESNAVPRCEIGSMVKLAISGAGYDRGDAVFVELLGRDERTARAVATALCSGRNLTGSTLAPGHALVRIIGNPEYSESTRGAAADAFAHFALSTTGERPDPASALRTLLGSSRVPESVKDRAIRAFRCLRPQDFDTVASFVANELDPGLQPRVLRCIHEGSVFLTEAQVAAFRRRFRTMDARVR